MTAARAPAPKARKPPPASAAWPPTPLELVFDLDHILSGTGRRFASAEEALAAYRTLPEADRFDPSVFFSRAFYRHCHADVAQAGLDPLLHFLGTGHTEERSVHPLFDAALLRVVLQRPDALYFTLLAEFAAGRIAASPHLFLDFGFIREQLGEGLTALEIFRLVADVNQPPPVVPHPLFSPSYYALNAAPALRNELADYAAFQPSAAYVHPLFSPSYYLTGRSEHPDVPALLLYLRNWHDFRGDPSLLADLKFINHQLSLRQVAVTGDPLTEAMRYVGADATPLLHPHVDPRMIDFAFANILEEAALPSRQRRLAKVLTRLFRQGAAAAAPAPASAPARPLVSVIILNYRKPAYTLLSLLAAGNALRNLPHEIIVIENGGEPFDFEEMSRLLRPFPQVRLYKMQENKFFGEGNNLGIERARGDNILFLNNDCFLHESFGRELEAILRERPDIHAIGGTLYFPDGTIQEFGGVISDCGRIIQRGKHLDAGFLAQRREIEVVDYASAACLLVSRRAITAVAGFDPAFEPVYYEDTDLCRRLKVAGFDLHVSARLRGMHMENATTRELLGTAFNEVIARNRNLFARRWLKENGADTFVPGRHADPPPAPAPPAIGRARPTAVVYTPFDVRAGGGERYLLSAARALAATHDVVVATEDETSAARIRFVCHALGIAPFRFATATLREVLAGARRPELTFVMGNEIVPPVPALGQRNIYHLQFPFPWRNVKRYDFQSIAAYDCLVVNSGYTREWTLRRFAEVGVAAPPPVHVLFPPVRLLRPAATGRAGERPAGKLRVVTVGRFFTAGHSKRQDAFLDIVALARAGGLAVHATMVGGVHNTAAAKAFFTAIETRARGMADVELLVDASRQEVEQVLRAADAYIHCAGLGVRTAVAPELAEHFGIAIVEALSAGCYPLAAAAGGPLEIIHHSGTGASFATVEQAVLLLQEVADGRRRCGPEPPAWLQEVSEAAFDRRLHEITAAWAARPAFDSPAVGSPTLGNPTPVPTRARARARVAA